MVNYDSKLIQRLRKILLHAKNTNKKPLNNTPLIIRASDNCFPNNHVDKTI